jgi:O-antigen/teichoic acid export membrane protein
LSVRRALFVMLLSSNATTLVHFGVTVVLARLLSPSDVGIFSMTVVFSNIAGLFRDFGVTAYLQREPDLTDEKRASALTFLLITSWGTAATLYLISEPVAAFFNEPGVGRVMRVFCLSFVIVPFASYFYALLARDLQAGRHAMIGAVGTVAYCATCLTLAALDYGYMSLAWANFVNIAATIAAHLVVHRHRLPRRLSLSHWRALLHFGGGSLAGAFLERVNQSIPDLMLGKINGAYSVGLFSRANGLMGLMGQIIWPAVSYTTLPFLARSHREHTPLGPIIIRGLSLVCMIGWPVYFGMALFSEEVIRVVFGLQWLAAAPLAAILAVGFAARLLVCLNAPALTAIGRPYLSGAAAGVDMTARVIAVSVSGATELWHFAVAIALADVLTASFPLWQMRRYLGLRLRDLLRSLSGTLKACSLPCATMLTLRLLLPSTWPDALTLLVALGLGAIAWLAGMRLTRHPLLDELRRLIVAILPLAAQRVAMRMLG